jgi:hypothetical protein
MNVRYRRTQPLLILSSVATLGGAAGRKIACPFIVLLGEKGGTVGKGGDWRPACSRRRDETLPDRHARDIMVQEPTRFAYFNDPAKTVR